MKHSLNPDKKDINKLSSEIKNNALFESNGWISVEDELPSKKEDDCYLCLCDNRKKGFGVCMWVGYYDTSLGFDHHEIYGHSVGYWMQLPELPKSS